MQVQKIQNNNYNNPNFGAKIIGTRYMRQEARYIAKQGSIEDKIKLFNFLKVIKDDNSFGTFVMDVNTQWANRCHDRLCEYFFYFDKGNKEYKHEPIINNSLELNGEGGDKHFLSKLGEFIKQHYGEEVYNNACESKPEYVERYHASTEKVHKQLKTDIRDTLDLEPLSYTLTCNGKKIPNTRLGIPDDDYVC